MLLSKNNPPKNRKMSSLLCLKGFWIYLFLSNQNCVHDLVFWEVNSNTWGHCYPEMSDLEQPLGIMYFSSYHYPFWLLKQTNPWEPKFRSSRNSCAGGRTYKSEAWRASQEHGNHICTNPVHPLKTKPKLCSPGDPCVSFSLWLNQPTFTCFS